MKTYFIDDYIKNDKTALSVVTDFKTNKLIIKGSTGIGGTSAILSITDQTIIVVSPLVGMIADKESQCDTYHNLFIYENSKHSWKDVSKKIRNEEHFILNTTPDQIMALKKCNSELFIEVKKIPLFVDESHMAAETDYRKSLAEFNHEVFTNWENHFTLSTATPVHKNLDIPKHIIERLEVISIKRRISPTKPITIYNHRNYEQWVLNEIANGNKVVLFSNDENVYKRFFLNHDLNIQPLVGKHLEKKIATFIDSTNTNLTNKLELGKDLYILSTKFLTGYDITFDASVAILTNENTQVETRYVNDIVQAYGRLRGKVLNAAIFYNNSIEDLPFDEDLVISQIKNDLVFPSQDTMTDGKVNHTLVINKHLPSILRHQTYSSIEMLSDNLKAFGFAPVSEYIEDARLTPTGISLPEKIQCLLTMDEYELCRFTEFVFMNIGGNNPDYNGFSERLVMLYACAYIAKECENTWLNDKLLNTDRYEDLIQILKTFIDVNIATEPQQTPNENMKRDIYQMLEEKPSPSSEMDKISKYQVSDRLKTLAINGGAISHNFAGSNQNQTFRNAIILINTFHVINLVKKNELDEITLQKMEIENVLSVKIKEHYLKCIATITEQPIETVTMQIETRDISLNDKMYNRAIRSYFKHTFERVVSQLSFIPTDEQKEILSIRLDKQINLLGKWDNNFDIKSKLNHIDYSMEKQKEYHKYYLLGMASLIVAGHMAGFKYSRKHNREYNVATKVTKSLRKCTPYKMLDLDIRSANAQIVDRIFETNIGMEVYQNLMLAKGISRDKAKVLYNSTLNNYKLSKTKAKQVFLDCGYPEQIANKIASKTTSDKIYFEMCQAEERIISGYREAINPEYAIRCHDGLLMLATPNNRKKVVDIFEDIHFGICHY